MEFAEKLHTLMSTFSVSNSRLAASISVDPSLISRWRSGSRTPSRKNNYIESIATFFVSRLDRASQRVAILEILGLPASIPMESDEMKKHLTRWLENSQFSEDTMIDNLLAQMQTFGKTPRTPSVSPPTLSLPAGQTSQSLSYYGIEGKQAGVLQFLTQVLQAPAPVTMLLFSDESMDWLTGDPEYYITWGYIASLVLKKGHRIKIIHTLQRDINEMQLAIERWLPLYMSGGVEPYYFPRYREQIFRRTLFVAPGVASFTSVSLPDTANQAVQELSNDPKTIHALTEEFIRFLSFCRPLMKVLTGSQLSSFPSLLGELEEQPAKTFSSGVFPSSLTIPPTLIPDLLNSAHPERDRLLAQHLERTKRFYEQLDHYDYTEILFLPSETDLISLGGCSDFSLNYFTDNPIYMPSQLKAQLIHIADLLLQYPRFQYILACRSGHGPLHIVVKEDIGVLVQKTDHPHIAFAFNQPNLTYSFYQYLDSISDYIPREQRSRSYTRSLLLDMAARL